MDSKPPKGDRKSPGKSSSVKLRENKEKSSVSRIKKLKRRISASFSRLSVSRDDSASERTGRNGQQTNGYSDGVSCPSREISQSPPGVFYSLTGTPDHKPIPHHLHNLGQSLDDQKPTHHNIHKAGQSLDESELHSRLDFQQSSYIINNASQYNEHVPQQHHDYVNVDLSQAKHSVSQPLLDYYHKDVNHGNPVPMGSHDQLESQPQANFPPPPPADIYHHQYTEPHPAILNLKHSPVKRHCSTGDMLNTELRNPSVQRRDKSRRPKSEGSVEAFRSRRASSFGYNSQFGKEEAYEKLEQLGEGSYATVYKGISLLTNKVVALKEIRLQPEEGTPFTAIREASLLKTLKHFNIVTLHDIIHTKDTLTFVFEYVHTDLSQYLEKHTGGLNPRNVKLYLFQLLRGLDFCHERRILHRDLKPQNLLISEIGELKLADFGLARAKSVPSRTYSHEVVTLWYRPPDVLLGSTEYTTSLDMWGVGCIFAEMVSGVATFPGMKDTWDQLDRIWRLLGTPTEDVWPGVSSFSHYCRDKFGLYLPQQLSRVIPKLAHIPQAESLAQVLLQLQPEKRISAKLALRHVYFHDLPQSVYEIADLTSVFDIPGIRLAPEMDQYLRTRIYTNPHMKAKPL